MIFIVLIVILAPIHSLLLAMAVLSLLLIWIMAGNEASGKDMGLTVLLCWVFSGAGMFYIGSARKGLMWYITQLGGLAVSYAMNEYGVEGLSVGLMIMVPFLAQMLATAIEYNKKYGGFR
jgi:hypothetical protein